MEINPFIFNKSPEICFGPGSTKDIDDIVSRFGKKMVFVHGKNSLKKSLYFQNIVTLLTNTGIKLFFVEIPGEPSPALIDSAVALFAKEQIKAVCSIGGGSVIDAGKAISAMLPLAEPVATYLEIVGTKQHPGVKVPFIAIPTTSGAGTEATYNAVLSEVGINGFKRSLRHRNLMPDIAIIDPHLMTSCPASVTAACGMDALTQLLEAFVSTKANDMTDALAVSGLQKIATNLVAACTTHAQNVSVRGNMAYAALLSGLTLANAGLGVVHGFAASLGARFPIPHGVVCGTMLVPCTRITISKLLSQSGSSIAINKYALAGSILSGTSFLNQQDACFALVDTLQSYADTLAIPHLHAFGVTKEFFPDIIADTGNKNNPVKLDKSDLEAALLERL